MRGIFTLAVAAAVCLSLAQGGKDATSKQPAPIQKIEVHVPEQPVKILEVDRAPPVVPIIKTESTPDWVNLWTALGAIAAATAAIIGYLTVLQMKQQAEAAKESDVLTYFTYHEESDQLHLVVENFGGGPAQGITTTLGVVLDEEKDQEYYIVKALKKTFSIMPPGFRFSTPVGTPSTYRGNAKLCKPFKVEVNWKNAKGEARKREVELDVSAFVDAWSPRSEDAKLAESVEELADQVKWFNRSRGIGTPGGRIITRGFAGSESQVQAEGTADDVDANQADSPTVDIKAPGDNDNG